MATQHILESEILDPIRKVERTQDLTGIADEEVGIVIWKRQMPLCVSAALQHLPTHDVENGRYSLPVGQVGDCVLDVFRDWGWQINQAQEWLADDVQALACQMAEILSVSTVCLRVDLVRDNACRKFHQDAVKARLICTYSGPGTEIGLAGADSQPHNIKAVPTGQPLVLKGKLWPNQPQHPVLHRSPPIEGTGLSRLVVVLDGGLSDLHLTTFQDYTPNRMGRRSERE